jgi:hypothetical protein
MQIYQLTRPCTWEELCQVYVLAHSNEQALEIAIANTSEDDWKVHATIPLTEPGLITCVCS